MSTLLDGSREDASRRDWQHILHIDAALLFGLLARWPKGRLAVQAGGGAIALVGTGFLLGVL